MEENKETLELLRKIEKNSRMQTYSGYARTGLVLVCAVCVVVLTCAVMKLLPHLIRHGSAVTPSPKGKTFFALYCPYYHI